MPRQSQQRRKLLVIKDFLERESDEQHPVTMAQIIAELARRGIPAERKSIYLDLEALREHGMDIIMVREGQLTGYFLGKRAFFELPELRLLVDAVQSSRFITYKKSPGTHQQAGAADQCPPGPAAPPGRECLAADQKHEREHLL